MTIRSIIDTLGAIGVLIFMGLVFWAWALLWIEWLGLGLNIGGTIAVALPIGAMGLYVTVMGRFPRWWR